MTQKDTKYLASLKARYAKASKASKKAPSAQLKTTGPVAKAVQE